MALDKRLWVFDIPMNWIRNIKNAYDTDLFKGKNSLLELLQKKSFIYLFSFSISKLNILFVRNWSGKLP